MDHLKYGLWETIFETLNTEKKTQKKQQNKTKTYTWSISELDFDCGFAKY